MSTELEKQILRTVNDAVLKSITETLNSYNSPLNHLIKEIIAEHKPELKERFDAAIVKTIESKEFNKLVHEAFQHKLAKSLVAHFTGAADKAFNAMKNDPTIKAKAILAVENILNEATKG